MKTLKQTQLQDGIRVIALLNIDDWFDKDGIARFNPPVPLFVVGVWSDFNDGQKSNIEGRTTLGLFYDKAEAELFYHAKIVECWASAGFKNLLQSIV